MKTILVDDELLSMQQFEKECMDIQEIELVGKFDNAKDALAYAKCNQVDFALLDVQMPEMDGLEATKKIRALPRSDAKKVPIIAMTANAFSDDRIKAFEAGMTDHLAKPIDSKTLVQMLEKYLPAKIQD